VVHQVIRVLHRAGDRGGELLAVGTELGAEESASDDLERELRHLGRDVDGRPARRDRAEALEHCGGRLDHHVGERGDPFAVKRWLDQLALAPPEIAVAEHQPLAGDALQLSEDGSLPVVPVVVVEHATHVVGMNHQEGAPRRKRDLDQVAVAAPAVAEKAERVAPHRGGGCERREIAGSGRPTIGRGPEGRTCCEIGHLTSSAANEPIPHRSSWSGEGSLDPRPDQPVLVRSCLASVSRSERDRAYRIQ
jgi:hypothetical protein